jgi:prophage regulatory protein
MERILRLPSVLSLTGLSRSMLYRLIKLGLFVTPVSIASRSVGWPQDEIDAINAARIAQRTEKEIAALVAALKAARKLRDKK